MDFDPTNVVTEDHSDGTTSLFTADKQEDTYRRMQELLTKSGMTYSQLARVTYISERTITRYFHGKTKDPHFYTLCTMIIALGGDVNEILGVSPKAAAPAENPYTELITAYRDHTTTLTSAVDRMASRAKFLTIILFVLCLLVLTFTALEIVDLCNPNWGRYQWAVELFGSFLHKV